MPRPNPLRSLGGEETLARRVAYERERRGWSTQGLAQRMTDVGCPINQTAIWKIESGRPRRRITYDEALAFAEVFEVELEDLAIPPELKASAQLQDLFEKLSSRTKLVSQTTIEINDLCKTIRALLKSQSSEFIKAAFDDFWDRYLKAQSLLPDEELNQARDEVRTRLADDKLGSYVELLIWEAAGLQHPLMAEAMQAGKQGGGDGQHQEAP